MYVCAHIQAAKARGELQLQRQPQPPSGSKGTKPIQVVWSLPELDYLVASHVGQTSFRRLTASQQTESFVAALLRGLEARKYSRIFFPGRVHSAPRSKNRTWHIRRPQRRGGPWDGFRLGTAPISRQERVVKSQRSSSQKTQATTEHGRQPPPPQPPPCAREHHTEPPSAFLPADIGFLSPVIPPTPPPPPPPSPHTLLFEQPPA